MARSGEGPVKVAFLPVHDLASNLFIALLKKAEHDLWNKI